MDGIVETVHLSAGHTFSKPSAPSIQLLVGLGVDGDAHNGTTVKHRSRVARDPSQPNLRQVHLIHGELIDTLNAQGFNLQPGDMGENVTTRGIDLLGLPTGTRLHLETKRWSKSPVCATLAPSSTRSNPASWPLSSTATPMAT